MRRRRRLTNGGLDVRPVARGRPPAWRGVAWRSLDDVAVSAERRLTAPRTLTGSGVNYRVIIRTNRINGRARKKKSRRSFSGIPTSAGCVFPSPSASFLFF